MKQLKLLAVLFFCAAAHAQAIPPSSLNQNELGERVDSVLAGISFCPPIGSVQQRAGNNPDLVAEFVNNDKQWNFRVSKIHTPNAAPLTTMKDSKGEVHKGIQESVVDELRQQLPGVEIVRNDQTNVADSSTKYPNVGMI